MLPLNSELSLPFPARVIDFEFHAAWTAQAASITLTLVPVQDSAYRIQLLFTGVKNLSIPAWSVDGIRCALFEVSRLGDAAKQSPKWQDVEWMVGDFKMDTLTFYAKTAEVVSIEKL